LHSSKKYAQLAPIHFIGVAGTGMSALAQFMAMKGLAVSGSDRLFDQSTKPAIQNQLEALSITCVPQDGNHIPANTKTLVISSAIEKDNLELVAAQKMGIEVIHRSELLGRISDEHRTIAVSGTSGKSSTTAMIFETLNHAGIDLSMITGAGTTQLAQKGYIGNAWAGKSDLLVIEADESDGTLVRYSPEIGLILNIDKDHKDISELTQLFTTFRAQTQHLIVNSGHALSKRLSQNQRFDFGQDANCGFFGKEYTQKEWSIQFKCLDILFTLPSPGHHNMENALATIAVAHYLQLDMQKVAEGLAQFSGIHRRHTRLVEHNQITLIDDYAHNPAKVAAAIRSCQFENRRVLAWFQPHGFGPTRFLRKDFVEEICNALRPQDQIFFSEIYYAGGTVVRDISANDLIQDMKTIGAQAHFYENRADFAQAIVQMAQPTDVILLMGARDPSLEQFGLEVKELLIKT
jgi:UDP-N-acetylmuramate--alanine ligase